MKILVTGGAGFIGSHIVELFQGEAEIVVFDNLRTGNLANLEGLEHEFILGDVQDEPALQSAMRGVDYVFHLAALVSVPESMDKREECVKINSLGVLHALRSAADNGVRKLVFASSAAVYGDNPVSPKVETMRREPHSPYAVTKLDGEYYCDIFTKEGWLETAAIRFFNVFGPRQDPHSAYAAAVSVFIKQALANQPITIHGDGGQTRDFIYVKDIVRCLRYLATTPDLTGIYNCGYGSSITINDLVNLIIAETGSCSEVIYLPSREGDIRHSCACVDKLKDTGWRPIEGLHRGLIETIAAYKKPFASSLFSVGSREFELTSS